MFRFTHVWARACARLLVVTSAAGAALVTPVATRTVAADTTAQTLPLSQDWADTGLITTNDNWNGVLGVEGFLGQNITTSTGTDPQTLLTTSSVSNDLDVIANQSSTSITNGGVAEFQITDPVVALQGSGTADAPYLLIHLNTTGVTGVSVSYNLRDLDSTTDNSVQQVALQFRVGSSGAFTNVPAGYVADATTGPSQATLVTPVSVTLPAAADNQSLVQVRIISSNAAGNDEWVGVDDISVTAGAGAPTLSIGDVTVTEGDSGTTTANFTASLSQPAPAGGVTFDIATADNTATVGDNDYVARSLTAQSIPAGSQSYSFDVTVNGDISLESNETFFVNLTNITGATAGDAQGTGTISNDDVTLTAIHDIQGSGASSPIVGSSASTRGVVTGRKSNGFFMQEPDATVDADPFTSEAIFVFTSSTPPAAAAVGSLVQVTGTVTEFVPSADALQPPLTQLTSPTVVEISTGNPLPAVVEINPDPGGNFDQLERLEGMRVSVASLTVTAPTQGSISEANATSTSNGVFFGVVTGTDRPVREPGVQLPDPLPAGAPCCVPRFDTNPESIRVDSDGQTGAARIDVRTGAVVTGLVGPLDYGFRHYTILPDPATPPTVTSAGMALTPVTDATASEVTIATYNLQRFYDTVNDPATSDVVLTSAAFDNRLAKASDAIRNYLKFPDVIGVVEAENLSVLQSISSRVSSDAIANGQPDPLYVAYLEEGNDIGGIDVGYLVKTAPIAGGMPRVSVSAVVQEGKTTTWIDPSDNTSQLLNDRPSLRLMAAVNFPGGASFPVTVIVNHLRSLSGIADESPNGSTTVGDRVRQKRRAQSEWLANLVQARQAADANERIVLVGDFNAFEFSDGFVDSMGTITGDPAPANEVVLSSADLVDPNLVNLTELAPPAESYSYSFDGNAQSLDHVLVNQALVSATAARREEHARVNADFPEVSRGESSAIRLSDHDPVVAYFAPLEANMSVAISDSPDPVTTGSNVSYTIAVQNGGPVAASSARMTTSVPTGSTFVSVAVPAGWNCTTPGAGGTGPIDCQIASLAAGAPVSFTLVVKADCSLVSGTTLSASASVGSATLDSSPADNTDSETTTVTNPPPVITCPANMTVAGTSPTGAVVIYPVPSVTDNCPGARVVCTPAAGSFLPNGTTTVTCTATDSANVTSQCSFTVTVNRPAFNLCMRDDVTGEFLRAVTTPGASYGYWEYVRVNGPGSADDVIYFGFARTVVTNRLGTTLTDDDDPSWQMTATWSSRSLFGLSRVLVYAGQQEYVISDSNYTNSSCSQ